MITLTTYSQRASKPTDKGTRMDDRTAYRKGWDASRRSTTADLEGAESRFVGRYGSEHHASFVDGWTDYATDSDYQADKGTK